MGISAAPGSSPIVSASKASSTSRTSTTTLAVDPDLQLTLKASTMYDLRAFLVLQDNGGPDLEIQLRAPSLSGVTDQDGGLRQYLSDLAANTYYVLRPQTSGTSGTMDFDTSNTVIGINLHGSIAIGSSGGTVSFWWCQASSSGTASQILEGSYLMATEAGAW